jgi:biopolymer transport protein TolR
MSEINITPFVDVLLVLLVSFLISAPLMTLALPIQLPKGKLKERAPDYENSTLAVVNKNNQIYIDNKIYSINSLSRFLKDSKRVWEKSLPVYLQVDEKVPYKILIDVMLIFKNAGFRQVGLVIKQDF